MPSVNELLPWMVTVPVKLAAEEIVWLLMLPLVAIVVMPDSAPAELTSKLVEFITNGAEPPPIVTVPVEVPVLMLVLLLDEAFREIVPVAVTPFVTLIPALAVNNPALLTTTTLVAVVPFQVWMRKISAVWPLAPWMTPVTDPMALERIA